MKKKEKQQEWSKKIAEYKRSGKTKEEWCKKKNISIKQFNYWLRQFSEETPETQWLPVKIKRNEAGGAIRISQRETKTVTAAPLNIKIGAASIEVYPGYDKEFLLEILRVLKSL